MTEDSWDALHKGQMLVRQTDDGTVYLTITETGWSGASIQCVVLYDARGSPSREVGETWHASSSACARYEVIE